MSLQIQMTGKNIELTDTLRDYTKSKFEKLQRHADNILSIQVTFGVEKLRQIVEANIHIPGSDIHASAESEDMYNSITDLVDKLDRQINKHNSKH